MKEAQLELQSEEVKQLESEKKFQKRLSQGIQVSLDLEQNFKLYSYRIIGPEAFLDRIKAMSELFLKTNTDNDDTN